MIFKQREPRWTSVRLECNSIIICSLPMQFETHSVYLHIFMDLCNIYVQPYNKNRNWNYVNKQNFRSVFKKCFSLIYM